MQTTTQPPVEVFCRPRDCKWVAGLLWLFTAFLGLLLLVQAPFVVLFVLDREISIPPEWVEGAVSRQIGEDARITFSTLTLDKYGTLRLTDVKVENDRGRRIFTAGKVVADLFLPSTVIGFPRLDRIEGSAIKAWDPARPLGDTEPLVNIDSVCLRRDQEIWSICDFRARFGNIPVIASGTINIPLWAEIAEGLHREAPPVEPDFGSLAQRLREEAQRLVDPFLAIHIYTAADGAEMVACALSSQRVGLPFGISLDGETRAEAGFSATPDGILPTPIRFSAGRASFHGKNELLLADPTVVLQLPRGLFEGQLSSGASAFLSASRFVSSHGELLHPSLTLSKGTRLSIDATGQASLFGNPISVNADIQPLRATADVEVEGVLSINELLQHPAVPHEARKPELEFGKGLFVRLQSRVEASRPSAAPVRFLAETTGAANLAGFRSLYARASGTILPTDLVVDVERLSVQTPAYHLDGSYRHNFTDNRFRFLVQGGFLPRDIDGWMRPWWEELWSDFEIPNPARIDFDLSGDWDHRDERRLFGGIGFQNITLRGTEVERGHARMRSRPYLFELFDLEALRPEGSATGSFANLLDWETRETFAFLYDFHSTFALDAVSPLFGEEVGKIAGDFDMTDPPDLTIRGTLFPRAGSEGDPRESLLIEATADSPLRFHGIRLERLSFHANYGNDVLRVEPLRFRLGDGDGEGWILRRGIGEDSHRSFAITLSDADPASVVAAIPTLAKATGERFSDKRRPGDDSRNLDFSIECSGDPSAPETMLGEGSLDLKSPNLANVRLLGILSRISEELPLPFTLGSFQFEQVGTSFIFNKGLVEMPDLTLRSPTSRLLASGLYRIEEKTIDFDARMHLLGGTDIPVLSQIGSLLNPVGRVFEFRVWGPLDDLNWRLYLDPRSWN